MLVSVFEALVKKTDIEIWFRHKLT